MLSLFYLAWSELRFVVVLLTAILMSFGVILATDRDDSEPKFERCHTFDYHIDIDRMARDALDQVDRDRENERVQAEWVKDLREIDRDE